MFLLRQDAEEKELFSISPRSGTLLPGQQRAVYFSYRSAAPAKNSQLIADKNFDCFLFLSVLVPLSCNKMNKTFVSLQPSFRRCKAVSCGVETCPGERDSSKL